jgi:ABC-2 type transport system ATP-binding protein
LIDEVQNLLEHVVIGDGRILVDADAEELRGSATTLPAPNGHRRVQHGHTVLHRQEIGLAQVTVGRLRPRAAQAAAAGLEITPVSLQQLVVRLSG